jgi:hypothetical protein
MELTTEPGGALFASRLLRGLLPPQGFGLARVLG